MAGKSRFIIAESNIKKYFFEQDKVYSEEELKQILNQKRMIWNLPISMNHTKFIEKLVEREVLVKNTINFSGYYPTKIRYATNNSTVFHMALSLASKSYLSHYTAAFLLGLTSQVPKTIYLTSEQSRKERTTDILLKQKDIDNAFKKPQRKSGAIGIHKEYSIVLHNGMFSNKLGVFSKGGLSYTNLERTLIDITVRPAYAGGVTRVLEIFENSVDRISMNKLSAILKKLNYIYPYHQAIGFYLERVGMDEKNLSKLESIEKLNNFYLTYSMKDIEFNERWKIFFPKGI